MKEFTTMNKKGDVNEKIRKNNYDNFCGDDMHVKYSASQRN